MGELSGKVAILTADRSRVMLYRDLGPTPVQVKPNVVPVVEEMRDSATLPDPIIEVATTIEPGRVLIVRTARDRSAAEISEEKERLIDAIGPALNGLFNHENRLRAVEKALAIADRPALTPVQFRSTIKVLID